MAVVTKDSRSEKVVIDRADINDLYVSGLRVVESVRRDNMRSFRVCSLLSAGRFGVSTGHVSRKWRWCKL
jgi:hypothetical protein